MMPTLVREISNADRKHRDLKMKPIVCVLLFLVSALAHGKTALECMKLLGDERTLDSLKACILDDKNQPRKPLESSVDRGMQGHIFGVILGRDTLKSLNAELPNIIPEICEKDFRDGYNSVQSNSVCSNIEYFSDQGFVISHQGKELEITKDVQIKMRTPIHRYRHNPKGGYGMDLYFVGEELFMVSPTNGQGGYSLSENFGVDDFRKSTSKKYKHIKDSRWIDRSSVITSSVWALNDRAVVELIDVGVIYNNRRNVIDSLTQISYLPQSGAKIDAEYRLRKILIDGRFPRKEIIGHYASFYNIKIMKDVLKAIGATKQSKY